MNRVEADFSARNEALRLAVRCHEGVPTAHEVLLQTARDFHAFLMGDEPKAENA